MLNIRKRRRDADITQEQASKAINVTPAAISAWERGMGEPKLTQGLKLAKLYGCTPEQLKGGKK